MLWCLLDCSMYFFDSLWMILVTCTIIVIKLVSLSGGYMYVSFQERAFRLSNLCHIQSLLFFLLIRIFTNQASEYPDYTQPNENNWISPMMRQTFWWLLHLVIAISREIGAVYGGYISHGLWWLMFHNIEFFLSKWYRTFMSYIVISPLLLHEPNSIAYPIVAIIWCYS